MTCSVEDLQKSINTNFTENVLLEIVKNKSGLSDIKIDKITAGAPSKKGDSYLSTICRFSLDATGINSSGKKESIFIPVIVKSSLTNKGRRKTFRSSDFFENEAIFFDKVWPALEKFQKAKNIPKEKLFTNIPLALAAHIDGSEDFIALEDLSYQGFGNADRTNGLNYETTLLILEKFAHFHGVALAMKDQNPDLFENVATSLKETYFAEKFRSWYIYFQEYLITVTRDAVQKELPPVYLDKLNKLLENDFYGRICKLCEVRGPLSVITHGDAWIPNFLMRYPSSGDKTTPEEIIMIDFQLTRYTTLSNDFLFFLFSCADISLLEKHWDTFVNHYHKKITQTLELFGSKADLITLSDLNEDLKKSMDFGIGMSLEGVIMSMLNDDEICDFDLIQGEDAVPLESVWLVKPFKDQERRLKLASLVKFAVDKEFM